MDIVLHVGGAFGAAMAIGRILNLAHLQIVVGIVAFLVLSMLNRIFIQYLFQATIGKLLFGVCFIRDDNGGRPTLWSLWVQWWFVITFVVGGIVGLIKIMLNV